MAVGESDARVDESTRDELGTGLFCGALEGELREESRSGVVGEGYVEDLCGAALDGSDDEFTDTGGILKTISSDFRRLWTSRYFLPFLEHSLPELHSSVGL